jgi:hypothetical protein
MKEFRLAFRMQPDDYMNQHLVGTLRSIADQIERLGGAAKQGVVTVDGRASEVADIGTVVKDATGAWAIIKGN